MNIHRLRFRIRKYHKGDTVLLSGSRENPGKSIRSIKRDGYLALLAGGLFFLLICITGKQGFYTIISLILNTIIFAFGFQAFMKGENILKYLQCNCFSIFDNNSDLSEWNPQKNMGFCYFNHMRTVSDHGII
mgnify:CR=1 FL=1